MENKINRFSNHLLFLLVISGALYIQFPIIGKPYYYGALYSVLIYITIISNARRLDRVEMLAWAWSSSVLSILIIKAIMSKSFFLHLFIFNILMLPMAYGAIIRSSLEKSILYIKISFFLTYIVFFVELVYRILHPVVGGSIVGLDEFNNNSFYMFKISSLMYTNSNGVGMHVIFMLAFILTLHMIFKNSDRFVRSKLGLTRRFYIVNFFLLFAFSLTSLSRASIIVFVFITIFYYLIDKKMLRESLLLILPIVILGASFIGLPYLNQAFEDDGSFITKFQILKNLMKYLTEASFSQIMIGNTLDAPYEIYNGFVGYVGHTHYFELIFIFGLLFTLLYMSIFFMGAITLRGKIIIFLICFLLLGMSNIRIFAHYLFLYLGLAMGLCRLYSLKKL